MTPRLSSVTLVAVVGAAVPELSAVLAIGAALAREAGDVEMVLVAGPGAGAACPARRALALKALAGTAPDLTLVFLAEDAPEDVARLVGIEHAVGDYVLFCDLLVDRPADLPGLLAPLREGYDLVVAEARGADGVAARGGWPDRAVGWAYCRAYRLMTGATIDLAPTGLRVLSRGAALFVAGCGDAQLRLRAREIGPSFPAARVALPPGAGGRGGASWPGWTEGVGLMLSASAVPLRGASYAALAGGVLSAVYSLYVFAVFLFDRGVAAGWTTLSLQMSGMMFVFSVVLLFLSEYVIQIHAGAPPRSRRSMVARELRSPVSRRTRLLNVVDAEGAYHLGKPAWLDAGT